MFNEEYYKDLSSKIEKLQVLRDEAKTIAAGIIGESMLLEDFFFCTATDRCMQLIDGFICMLQARNMTCAGALLRLQLDNCMRTYAAFIAKDKDAFARCIINGDRLDEQRDQDGKKLKDGYLKDKLAQYDSLFPIVYDNASGYIHLSDKAFYLTISSCEDNKIEWGVGMPLMEKFNPLLLEAADAFIHFVELHFSILSKVVESKERFDKEN